MIKAATATTKTATVTTKTATAMTKTEVEAVVTTQQQQRQQQQQQRQQQQQQILWRKHKNYKWEHSNRNNKEGKGNATGRMLADRRMLVVASQ